MIPDHENPKNGRNPEIVVFGRFHVFSISGRFFEFSGFGHFLGYPRFWSFFGGRVFGYLENVENGQKNGPDPRFLESRSTQRRIKKMVGVSVLSLFVRGYQYFVFL